MTTHELARFFLFMVPFGAAMALLAAAIIILVRHRRKPRVRDWDASTADRLAARGFTVIAPEPPPRPAEPINPLGKKST